MHSDGRDQDKEASQDLVNELDSHTYIYRLWYPLARMGDEVEPGIIKMKTGKPCYVCGSMTMFSDMEKIKPVCSRLCKNLNRKDCI